MRETKRPGVYIHITNRSPETGLYADADGGGWILSAEIIDGVFYLKQTPTDGGFTVEVSDGAVYLKEPPAGSSYKAEVINKVFYLRED